ncbi:MAG TPA: hypothetical protein VF131_24325 [Blastocatellia bacterium]|nr:hypothetical protein [Blastocatellia bacterium]
MSNDSNVNRFIAELTEYLRLEHYITPQTKAKIFDLVDTNGDWCELMNEDPLIEELLWHGMPQSHPILRVYLSGRNIYQQAAKKAGKPVDKTKEEKMGDYVVVSFGVAAECDEVMSPYTGSTVTVDYKKGEAKVRVHVWRQSLFCRNTRPRYESFFISPGSPAAQYYKTHNWWGRVEEVDSERRDMLNELADGFILISRHPEMIVKSQRKPRMSEAQFLIEGQAAEVALAKAGETEVTMQNLANQMNKDRETISVCKSAYPDTWNKILQKFTEAKTYLKPSKNN